MKQINFESDFMDILNALQDAEKLAKSTLSILEYSLLRVERQGEVILYTNFLDGFIESRFRGFMMNEDDCTPEMLVHRKTLINFIRQARKSLKPKKKSYTQLRIINDGENVQRHSFICDKKSIEVDYPKLFSYKDYVETLKFNSTIFEWNLPKDFLDFFGKNKKLIKESGKLRLSTQGVQVFKCKNGMGVSASDSHRLSFSWFDVNPEFDEAFTIKPEIALVFPTLFKGYTGVSYSAKMVEKTKAHVFAAGNHVLAIKDKKDGVDVIGVIEGAVKQPYVSFQIEKDQMKRLLDNHSAMNETVWIKPDKNKIVVINDGFMNMNDDPYAKMVKDYPVFPIDMPEGYKIKVWVKYLQEAFDHVNSEFMTIRFRKDQWEAITMIKDHDKSVFREDNPLALVMPVS